MTVVVMVEERVSVRQLLASEAEEGWIHQVVGLIAPGVVEHQVQNHGDAALVRRVDQGFQRIRPSVDPLGRHIEGGVVAPRAVARKLADRHQFDGVDTEPGQVVEPGLNAGEVAEARAAILLLAGKIAHAQLIDSEVAERGPTPGRVVPGVNRLVAQECFRALIVPANLAGVRIGHGHLLTCLVLGDEEPVLGRSCSGTVTQNRPAPSVAMGVARGFQRLKSPIRWTAGLCGAVRKKVAVSGRSKFRNAPPRGNSQTGNNDVGAKKDGRFLSDLDDPWPRCHGRQRCSQ